MRGHRPHWTGERSQVTVVAGRSGENYIIGQTEDEWTRLRVVKGVGRDGLRGYGGGRVADKRSDQRDRDAERERRWEGW